MNSSDEKIKKFFDNLKEHVEIDSNIQRRLITMIQQKEQSAHRRRILMGAIGLAVVGFLVISSALPVFGKSGTLPQVISGISVQRAANSFTGSISTNSESLNALKDQKLSPTDSIIIAALAASQPDAPIDKIIQMRKDGIGWGKILSDLGISVSSVKNAISKTATTIKTSENQQNNKGENAQIPNSNNQDNENANQCSGQENKGNGQENEHTHKVLVIKGAVENISDDAITVNGGTINITDKTPITYHGKSITVDKLKKGDEVLIKATKTDNNIKANSILVIKMNSANGNENKEENEKENVEKESYKGTIRSIDSANNTITLNESEIVFKISQNTVITYHGKNITLQSLNVGDSVNIIGVKNNDGSTTAEKIIVIKMDSNEKNKNGNNNGKGNDKSNKGKGKP